MLIGDRGNQKVFNLSSIRFKGCNRLSVDGSPFNPFSPIGISVFGFKYELRSMQWGYDMAWMVFGNCICLYVPWSRRSMISGILVLIGLGVGQGFIILGSIEVFRSRWGFNFCARLYPITHKDGDRFQIFLSVVFLRSISVRVSCKSSAKIRSGWMWNIPIKFDIIKENNRDCELMRLWDSKGKCGFWLYIRRGLWVLFIDIDNDEVWDLRFLFQEFVDMQIMVSLIKVKFKTLIRIGNCLVLITNISLDCEDLSINVQAIIGTSVQPFWVLKLRNLRVCFMFYVFLFHVLCDKAFDDCEKLVCVWFRGPVFDWSKISLGVSLIENKVSLVHYYFFLLCMGCVNEMKILKMGILLFCIWFFICVLKEVAVLVSKDKDVETLNLANEGNGIMVDCRKLRNGLFLLEYAYSCMDLHQLADGFLEVGYETDMDNIDEVMIEIESMKGWVNEGVTQPTLTYASVVRLSSMEKKKRAKRSIVFAWAASKKRLAQNWFYPRMKQGPKSSIRFGDGLYPAAGIGGSRKECVGKPLELSPTKQKVDP